MMQFAKPRKMMNPINPGTHFMTTTTYDAREYLNAVGSGFDRANLMNGSGPSFYRPHDQMAYISAERAHNFSSLPVPIGMFMNIGHPVPARGYFNQQQQNNGQNSKSGLRNRGRNARHGVQFAREESFGSQVASQEPAGHSFSDGPLTQAPLSMSQISQPAFTGFSQPVLSQAGLSQVRSFITCFDCSLLMRIYFWFRMHTMGRICGRRLRASFRRTLVSTTKKGFSHLSREELSTRSRTERISRPHADGTVTQMIETICSSDWEDMVLVRQNLWKQKSAH